MASPTITLSGDTHVVITEADLPWSDPGATASDSEDGDISDDITITGKSPDAVGIFALFYNVTDSDGNEADTAVRTILVTETLAASEYRVEWKADGGASYTKETLSSTSQSLSGLQVGAGYQWRVRSIASTGRESAIAGPDSFSTLSDTDSPTLTLLGDNPQTVTLKTIQDDGWTDPGATASDNIDGDMTSEITVSGTVDAAVGSYSIEYSVTDSSGNTTTKTRTVEVVHYSAPIIELSGGMVVTIDNGDAWSDPGYTATDEEDGDLTAKVTVTGSVDSGTPGVYQLGYSVTDFNGKTGKAIRFVVVNEVVTPSGYEGVVVELANDTDGTTDELTQDSSNKIVALTRNTAYTVRIKGTASGSESDWSSQVSFVSPLVIPVNPGVGSARLDHIEITATDYFHEVDSGDLVLSGSCNLEGATVTVTVNGTDYKARVTDGQWTVRLKPDQIGVFLTEYNDELITQGNYLVEQFTDGSHLLLE